MAPSVSASTTSIASLRDWPLGKRPSVSTVKEITHGIPSARAARATPIWLVRIRQRERTDEIRRSIRECLDLRLVVALRFLGGHLLVDAIAVPARPDAAADDQLRRTIARRAKFFQKGDPAAVDVGERFGRISETIAPIGVCTPRRRVEHYPDSVLSRNLEVRRVVRAEGLEAIRIVQKHERGEIRQIDSVVEDQRRLHAAVGDEHLPRELRELTSNTPRKRILRRELEDASVPCGEVQLAGGVLAEGGQGRDAESLASHVDGSPVLHAQAPDDPGAVVAEEVAAGRRCHSPTAVHVAAGHGAAALVVAVDVDRSDELAGSERGVRIARAALEDMPAVVRES